MRIAFYSFCFALVFFLNTTVSYAQRDPGQFTIQYGFNASDHPRHTDAGFSKQKAPVNFRLKVHPRLTIGVDNETYATTIFNNERIRGVGSTVLFFRPQLIEEDITTLKPQVNLTYTITLPSTNASKGIGSSRADHKFLGNIYKFINPGDARRTKLGTDVGVFFAGRKGKSGFTRTGLLNLYFEQELDNDRKYTLHVEVDSLTRTETKPSQIFSTNYLTRVINKYVSFNVGMNVGITPNSPRIGGFASVRFTGRLWKVSKE